MCIYRGWDTNPLSDQRLVDVPVLRSSIVNGMRRETCNGSLKKFSPQIDGASDGLFSTHRRLFILQLLSVATSAIFHRHNAFENREDDEALETARISDLFRNQSRLANQPPR